MAQIKFSLAELFVFLESLGKIPSKISIIEIDQNIIKFSFHKKIKLKTTLEFIAYEQGNLIFQLRSGWFIDNFFKMLSFISNKYMDLDYPKLTFFLQNFVSDRLQMIEIDDITFENGEFNIQTKIQKRRNNEANNYD